jgi:hypothetical protein
MLLPDDSKRCKQSLLAIGGILMFFYSVAYYSDTNGVRTLKSIAVISIVFGGLLYKSVIDATWESYLSKHFHAEKRHIRTHFSQGSNAKVVKFFPPMTGVMVLFVIGFIWQRLAIKGATKVGPLDQRCETLVNNGHWIAVDGCHEAVRGLAFRNQAIQNFATCGPSGSGYMWGWEVSAFSAKCRFTQRNAKEMKKKLSHRRIGFVGDSMTRNLYHAFSRILGMNDAGLYDTNGPKHSNITRSIDHTDFEFKWAPFVSDQVELLKEMNGDAMKWDVSSYDLVLVGGGAWDRLHRYRFGNNEEKEALSDSLSELVEQMSYMKEFGIPIVWMTPTTINTPALNSQEKRDYMTEDDMNDMRNIYEQLGVTQAASFVLNGPSFSEGRVKESFDGVHYPPDVYSAGAQIFANALDWLLPTQQGDEKLVPPEPGKMARPFLGCIMLCLCFIGLFCFDGFLGFSYAACFIVKDVLPNDLYLEAFSKLHEKCGLPPLALNTDTFIRSNKPVITKKRITVFPADKTRRKKVTFLMDKEVEPFIRDPDQIEKQTI